MKNALILFVLLTILFGGCRKSTDIGPADLLYQRWQFFQTRRVDETTWAAPYRAFVDDTEYRPDGALIYRRDGVIMPTPCCSGGRFERTGVVINYTDFPSCPSVRCSFTNNSTINILRENLLEIQTGNLVTQYTPVK